MNLDAGQQARRALNELRAARRRQRMADFDLFEAIYRVYLTGITLTMAVLLLAGVTGDRRLGPSTVASVRHRGAAAVGMAIAFAWAIGLRSGGRGGPLVVEGPDVSHVLLAPVDRAAALRGPAIRLGRFALLLGAGAGALAGLLAARRLPGHAILWVASSAAAGLGAVALALGAAMLISGLRQARWVAALLGIAVLAWSAADVTSRSVTSPASLLGSLALWPLGFHAVALAGVAVAVLVAGGGLALVGGTSLEAMQRRASLIGQLRFAVTLQDVRTVIVLRRQLAQEAPKGRPWLRMPRALPSAGRSAAHPRRLPVWRRCWHGILRWPGARLARLAGLGALAGVALVGVWRGTTPLIVVAGVALFVAGLDAVEPLAQEVDHPDRRDAVPVLSGRLHLRQLGAGTVVMVCVAGVGVGAAAVLTGGDRRVLSVGVTVAVTGALTALGGAAVSVIKGPPPPVVGPSLVPPEAAGARAMFRLIWPPTIAVIGLLPLLAARAADRKGQPLGPPLAGAVQGVILLIFLVLAWVRFQAEAHDWWDAQMSAARPTSRPEPHP